MNAAATTPTEGHNSEARKKIINDVCRQVAELEAERAEIGAQIREIKQKRIKSDLGMKLADFNAALRLYRLDDDAQATFLDTLRETFQALGKGSQLDFLAVQQKAETVREEQQQKAEKKAPAKGGGKKGGGAPSQSGGLLIDPITTLPTRDGYAKLALAVKTQHAASTKAGKPLSWDEALTQVLCASIWRDVDDEKLDREKVLGLIDEARPLKPVEPDEMDQDGGDESPAAEQKTGGGSSGADDDGLSLD